MLYFHFNTLGYVTCTTSERVKSPSQTWEVNKINSFKFAIHLTDPSSRNLRKRVTYVTIYDDVEDDVIFRGRVFSVSKSSDGFAQVTCEGPLGYLHDGIYRGPDVTNTYTSGQSTEGYGTHVLSLFGGWMFLDYNQFVDAKRQFAPAIIWDGRESADKNWNNGLIREDLELNGLDCYEAFYKVIDALGWEFQLVYTQTAPHYQVHISQFFGYQCTTPITSSFNLKSSSVSSGDGDDGFYTSVFPMGGYSYDGKRLQLRDANVNSPLDVRSDAFRDSTPGNTWQGNQLVCAYVDNKELVKKYGRIFKCVTFDNIVANSAADIPNARQRLYAAAADHARKLSEPKLDIDISAYDLKRAGFPVDELKVSNIYEVIDPITDLHVLARLTSMTRYYDKPLEPDLTFEYYKYNKAGDIQ